MSNEDNLINYFLRDELRVVNKYIPRERKELKDLLKEKYPYVRTRDGGIHMFRRSELKLAKELLKESGDRLKLPIYLELQPQLTETTAVVKDPIAIELISKLLGIPEENPLYLYPPHLAELRGKIRTLFIYLISPKALSET